MRLQLFGLTALLCSVCLAGAQNETAQQPVKTLTVDQVIQMALENNFDIAIGRISAQAIGYDLEAAYGAYDPVYQVTALHSENSREGRFDPTSSALSQTSTTESDSLRQQIAGTLPTGLRYGLGLDFAHDTGTAGGGSTFDTYTANLGIFTLRQPLLRNMWIDATRRGIKVLKLNRDVSNLEFEYSVMSVLTSSQKAYYSLVSADAQVLAESTNVVLAAKVLDDARKMLAAGTQSPLEVDKAESEYFLAKSSLEEALNARQQIENQLKSLLTRKYPELHGSRIEALPGRVYVARESIDLQSVWKDALAKRPDYRAKYLEVEKQRIDLVYTKNQLFPTLDVFGTYGRNGLDDLAVNSLTGAVINDPTLGGAFHDLRRNTTPYHTYGVVLSVPLSMRAERYNHRRAKSNKEIAVLDLMRKEQQVLVEIDNTVNTIRSSIARRDATRVAKEASWRAYNAERTKMLNGASTPTEVLRKQKDALSAETQYLRAVQDHDTSLVDLSFQDGTMLERLNIQVQNLR